MISIIIPVYNTPSCYLRECVASIVNQTVGDWEAIIVDDGSESTTELICREIASGDSRIKLVRQLNSGPGPARNRGLECSCGDRIIFVDSDDSLHPRCLEIMTEVMDRSNCPVVVSRTGYQHRYEHEDVSTDFVVVSKCQIIEDMLYQQGVDSGVWGKMFSRGLFNGIRFRDCWYEDLDIIYRLYDCCGAGIASTECMIYYYRSHPASFMRTFSSRRFDILDVVDRLDDYAAMHLDYVAKAVKARRFAAANHILSLVSRHNVSEQYPEQVVRCRTIISECRYSVLLDRKARVRDRLGALISYFGLRLTMILLRIFNRNRRS